MHTGCLIQGSRKIEVRNLHIMSDAVIAETASDAMPETGDASLVIGGTKHGGVVAEVLEGRITFRPVDHGLLALKIDAPDLPASEAQPDGEFSEPMSRSRKISRAFFEAQIVYFARRFLAAAYAPSFPSAVRVALGRWATVFFLFAAAAAFLMFLRATDFCFSLICDDRLKM